MASNPARVECSAGAEPCSGLQRVETPSAFRVQYTLSGLHGSGRGHRIRDDGGAGAGRYCAAGEYSAIVTNMEVTGLYIKLPLTRTPFVRQAKSGTVFESQHCNRYSLLIRPFFELRAWGDLIRARLP